MLDMAALTAARCDPTMHADYQRLAHQGKPTKVALVACLHKLLTIANAILRDGVPWRAQGGAVACQPTRLLLRQDDTIFAGHGRAVVADRACNWGIVLANRWSILPGLG